MKFSLIVLSCIAASSIAYNPGDPASGITWNEFVSAVTQNGFVAPQWYQYQGFIQGLSIGRISTRLEAAMALGNFIHETAGLTIKSETRCVNNGGCGNEFSDPAGCPYMDKKYYGRGYIQLSHCYNYRDASAALGYYTKLVEDPDSVAYDDNISWQTAFWYWSTYVHDAPGVQQGQFGSTVRAINGNYECAPNGDRATFDSRYGRFMKVFYAFGISGAPNGGGCW